MRNMRWLYKFIMTLIVVGVLWISTLFANTVSDALIQKLHGFDITIFTTVQSYRANDTIRRDEASKMFVRLAELTKKTMYVKPESECRFSDLSKGHFDLQSTMIKACRLWIFQWYDGKFHPTQGLTNAQAVAVLIRILWYNPSELGVSHWADNYYVKAQELGIGNSIDVLQYKDRLATRGTLALLIGQTIDKYISVPFTHGWKTLRNKDTKIVFDYPADWNLVVSSWDNQIQFARLQSRDTTKLFMVADNWQRQLASEDSALYLIWSHIIDENYIKTFCDRNDTSRIACKVKTNDYGIKYVEYTLQAWPSQSQHTVYLLYNPKSNYKWIVVSTEYIGKQYKKTLSAMVESIRFMR